MSKLLIDGELILYGDVVAGGAFEGAFSSRDVLDALADYGNGHLSVRINSPGGHVFEGVAIYNALADRDAKTTIYVDGIAASAASVIAMAGLVPGNELVMRQGAQLMIHPPMSDTWGGTAKDHEKSADMLAQLEEQIAQIYAVRTGMNVEEIRTMMAAETWLTADDAVSFGFATRVEDTEKQRQSAEVPAMAKVIDNSSATRAAVLPVVMSTDTKVNIDPAAAIDQETVEETVSVDASEAASEIKPIENRAPIMKKAPAVDNTAAIFQRCVAAKLDMAATSEIIANAKNSVDLASRLIIDKLADNDTGGQRMPRVEMGADARSKFVEGATKAIMARAGMQGGERNEYSGMTMREIALESLRVNNVTTRFTDPMTMVAAAMRPQSMGLQIMPRMDGSGLHSTSDFSNITSNVAHKSMLRGFEDAEETFDRWTATGTLTDFKTATRVDMGLFPSLQNVPEGAEFKFVTLSDRAQTVALATYGNIFAITRQAIINDDLSVFTRLPSRMGRAARRTVGDLVYALLTDNGLMPDNLALFHATHGNLVAGTPGAPPSVDTVSDAKTAMALQTDPDNNAHALNIRPAFLICPVALETTSRVLAAAQYDPAATLGTMTPNPHSGTFEVISDARLDANSSTAWYMAANPNAVDTIEVLYLNGVSTPVMEEREGFIVDGMEYKIRIDAGAQVFDYRGLYKNEG